MNQRNSKMARHVLAGVVFFSLTAGGAGGYALALVKGPAEMKGVTVTELGIIDEQSLKAQVGIEGFILRMRAVTVEPGGHIKEHNHKTSPALVRMFDGTWVEGRPDGSETAYEAGGRETIVEDKDTVHWIYNRGEVAATGVVCGIQPSK